MQREQTASPRHQGKSASGRLFDVARQWLPGGNSRHSIFFPPHPLYIASAAGCRVVDVDGTSRIDCINNMSALVHGHAFEPVKRAVSQQLERVMSAGMPTEVEVELARTLCERVSSVDRVRFCTSGSEAIMFAIRAARAYTGRNKIAKAEGAYHGSYDSVEISLTPPPDTAGPAQHPRAVPASPGLPNGCEHGTLVFPFNDREHTLALIDANADELAAVIVDPVISRLGFVEGDRDYLAAIRERCSRHGIVLIFDEVFSFRLAHGGSQALVQLEPDLTAFGKVIGGGLPIGAVGGGKAFMDVFDQLENPRPVEHSGTHFANPLSMAAGKAALDALDSDCLAHLSDLGVTLRDGMKEAFEQHAIPGHAAGVGSLVCALLAPHPLRNYRDFLGVMANGGATFGRALHRAMLDRGAQIVPGGGFILSSAMDHSDVAELLTMFNESLSVLSDYAEQVAAG